MKVVLDMNLPPSWVAFLADHGIDAVHWSSVGDPRAQDSVDHERARVRLLPLLRTGGGGSNEP